MAAKLDPTKWATAEQYAQHIGMNVWTVRKMLHTGTIPSYCSGGRYYVPIQRADEALEQEFFRPKLEPKEKKINDIGKEANAELKEAGGFKAALKSLLINNEEAAV